jgi:hypothetical protein
VLRWGVATDRAVEWGMADAVRLKARSYVVYQDTQSGLQLEMDAHTCCHCNRVVIHHPQRQRPRNVCRTCMALTCDSGGCVVACNPFVKDLDRAMTLSPRDDQPYLLRHHGEPIDRIYGPRGEELLVLRKDNGHTLREMSRRADEFRTLHRGEW